MPLYENMNCHIVPNIYSFHDLHLDHNGFNLFLVLYVNSRIKFLAFMASTAVIFFLLSEIQFHCHGFISLLKKNLCSDVLLLERTDITAGKFVPSPEKEELNVIFIRLEG